MIKAVLLDMDGTIFDTESIHKVCWDKAMEEAGIPYTSSTFYDLIGLNDESTKNYLLKNFGISERKYANLSIYAYELSQKYTRENGVPVKKGFFELQKYLKEHSIKTAVVTSSVCSVAENNFKLADITIPFDVIIGGDCVTKGKPDPEPYARAAEKLGLPPEECLAVEDSTNGIKSAFAAGIKCVYIKDIVDVPSEIRSLAAYEAQSLDKIIDIIGEINR